MRIQENRYYIDFQKSGKITDWLDYFSSTVWDALRANSVYGDHVAKVNEIEFTNKLSRDLTILTSDHTLNTPIRLWHSRNENANGNDLEVILEVESDKYLVFPCQCKRLFKGGNTKKPTYNHIWYANEEYGFQIESLVAYAKEVEGVPLYMFYNYVDIIGVSDDFGVTVCDGAYIANKYYFTEEYPPSITFEMVHPPAIKISDFVRNRGFFNYLYIKYQPKLYSSSDLNIIPGWKEINPPIEYSDGRNIYIPLLLTSNQERQTNEFIPKFRLMFTLLDFQHRVLNSI